MTSRNKILFNLNTHAPNKIKVLSLHPKKEWAALITTNNTFYLWNYRSKILIKSFNCNTLDDIKNFDIREMVFFDRYSLPYSIGTSIRANIIFVSAFRIYLYDYLTDAIKQINQKEIQQKNIRKVCVYSENKICVSLNDGSFKILDSKDLYSKNTMTIKNIRGYHNKPINWLIAYCQSANQSPRIITVSGQDGLMACWNIQTLLHSPHVPDPATPSFKFIMQKGNRHDSNNGQQIISLQYDNSSYRLVTLTQSYITVWSTMTGMELRRLKNHKFKQITFFNHFSFGANCFLAHSHKSQIVLLRINNNDYQLEDCIELKNFIREGDSSIVALRTLPQNPAQVFLLTQSCLVVIEINKFYRPSYGFSHCFSTRLSTLNNKQFIIRGEGCFKPEIAVHSVSKMQFEEEILFNSFYLSFEAGWIMFNLMEIQHQNMLFEQRRFKMKRVAEDSPFYRPTNSQALIEVRFDGRQFFIFNRDIAYFQIYGIGEDKDELLLSMNQQASATVDFYTKLELIQSGHARDIIWHQYKQQFALIKGFDKKGNPVEYVSEKKSMFGRGQRVAKLQGEVQTWKVCIFEKIKSNNRYEMVFMTDPLNTKLFRIYSFGVLFGYSSQDQNGSEVISFINNQNSKDIDGSPHWPERVFVSYCQSYQVFAYEGYFIIYKVQQNGNLTYFRSVQETIYQGMFWEKFFFFATRNSLFFLQVTRQDIILIKIAHSMGSHEQRPASFDYDDLQDYESLQPQGQLQMLSIVNMHLMMLNHSGQIILLNLKNYPYIQFCIQVIMGNTERLHQLFKLANQHIKRSMKDTLNSYGIILHDLN